MDGIAGQKSSLTWAVHISVVVLVALWLFPTLGLLVSSFRTADQISSSGWWASLFPAEQSIQLRTAPPSEQVADGGLYVLEGNLFEVEGRAPAEISVWGTSARDVAAYTAGETAETRGGARITVNADGSYRMESDEEMDGRRGARVFVTITQQPEFTLDNYRNILGADNREGMAKAFFNTLTVTIPATIIPILVAAFAAYALAWMDFPGRALLIAAVVGLLVVPLQLALIPLLKLHNEIGIGKVERFDQNLLSSLQMAQMLDE